MKLYWRNGIPYVRYQDQGRDVWRSLGKGTSEAQAVKIIKRLKQRRKEGSLGVLDPSRVRLRAFIDEYTTHRKKLALSPHTTRQDGKALESLASVLGENILLRSITQRKLQEWSGHMTGRGRSPFTVQSYLSHILAALETAAEWGMLAAPPKVKRTKIIKTPELLDRALTPDEMQAVIDKEPNEQRRALWTFAVWTGMRRQEIADLTWPKMHLNDARPWCTVVGKGQKERVVPLLPAAVQALQAFDRADVGPVFTFRLTNRPQQAEILELQGRGFSNIEIAGFYGVSDVTIGKWSRRPAPKPRAVTPDTLTKWLKNALVRVGIGDAHLHDLRHTAGTWMAARGVPERIIQSVLGHASIVTTQRYTKGAARVADLYKHLTTGL